MEKVVINRITSTDKWINGLSELMIKVVEDGASIGFLPPLSFSEAKAYWKDVGEDDALLFIATVNDIVVGSVQLQLSSKPNALHRAEIAKLMTHPNFRRKGIGRSLMEVAEEMALQEKRSLLVLDTREGDPSNFLYSSLGYTQAGRIPNYAISSNGDFDATIFYYKHLDK
ncbi:MAG TPA: N-acetyltransferase [Metabacillus sp.]|nr:N-acetyltransferase [Metabacillus sp.]